MFCAFLYVFCDNKEFSIQFSTCQRPSQLIGVHEASLCVLLVREILGSSAKLTFVSMLSTWCVFYVFGRASSVYDLNHTYKYWVRVCLLWVYVVIEHIMNSILLQINTWWKFPKHTLASTNLLGVIKNWNILGEISLWSPHPPHPPPPPTPPPPPPPPHPHPTPCATQGPLLLTWWNVNPSMDK